MHNVNKALGSDVTGITRTEASKVSCSSVPAEGPLVCAGAARSKRSDVSQPARGQVRTERGTGMSCHRWAGGHRARRNKLPCKLEAHCVVAEQKRGKIGGRIPSPGLAYVTRTALYRRILQTMTDIAVARSIHQCGVQKIPQREYQMITRRISAVSALMAPRTHVALREI